MGFTCLPWKETIPCLRKWWGNVCTRESSLRFHFKKDCDLLSMDNVLLSHYPLISGYHLGLIPGRENPLEKGMAIHSSILDWRIPWIEEACRLQSSGVTKSRTRLSNTHPLISQTVWWYELRSLFTEEENEISKARNSSGPLGLSEAYRASHLPACLLGKVGSCPPVHSPLCWAFWGTEPCLLHKTPATPLEDRPPRFRLPLDMIPLPPPSPQEGRPSPICYVK